MMNLLADKKLSSALRKEKLTKENLKNHFLSVRNFSEELANPLETEDYIVQSMPDVSPTKWHLAHTSWFFEAFVLSEADKKYKSLHPQYNFLFNSYYVQVGERHIRAQRGLLTRPTVSQVYEYREYVTEHVLNFIDKANDDTWQKFAPVIEIGIHHEQQHQELIVTDIKHVFSVNPLKPVYLKKGNLPSEHIGALNFVEFDGGIFEIGNNGEEFIYDNESPRHKTFLNPFSLGERLITNGEYLEFMEDGGYEKTELWLSDGAAAVENEKWNAPLYWEKVDGEWFNFKLTGFDKLNHNEPVCHISHYEADAFARWKDARLPTEAEWEIAADKISINGNFVEERNFHPVPLTNKNGNNSLHQMYGDVWEWTQSAYTPFPGYKPLPGALGEYNGKFMSNQIVLKGGSCATSKTHIRKTYRNFFPPHSRWQFMGLRLAKDLK